MSGKKESWGPNDLFEPAPKEKIETWKTILMILIIGAILSAGAVFSVLSIQKRHEEYQIEQQQYKKKMIEFHSKQISENMEHGHHTFKGHRYITFRISRDTRSTTVVHDPDCPKCKKVENEKRSED